MMRKVTILIADNNDNFSCLLEESLSLNSGIEIIGVAKDGLQTLKIVREKHPDVLLLDIVMPKADGLEVLRQMKDSTNKPLTFIISALGSREIIGKALQLGADYYFVKPLNSKTVLNKIREKCVQNPSIKC